MYRNVMDSLVKYPCIKSHIFINQYTIVLITLCSNLITVSFRSSWSICLGGKIKWWKMRVFYYLVWWKWRMMEKWVDGIFHPCPPKTILPNWEKKVERDCFVHEIYYFIFCNFNFFYYLFLCNKSIILN